MRYLILLSPLFFACNGSDSATDDDDTGDNDDTTDEYKDTSGYGGCEEVSRTDLTADEESPLGFTPQSVFDLALVDESSDFLWDAGGTIPFQFVVTATGTGGQYVEYDGRRRREIDYDCPNQLEVGVSMTFNTDDGVFAETWSGVVIATDDGEVFFYSKLDSFGGTFDIWDYVDDPDADSASASVNIDFRPDGSHGRINGQAQGSNPGTGGGDGTAWASNIQVGSWPASDGQ